MNLIHTVNDGPKIVSSTYWGSEWDRAGLYHVSANGGAWRLLLPAGYPDLGELLTAEGVAITRGWHGGYGREMLELLFDDGSEEPYAQWTVMEAVDRVPPEADPVERPLVLYGPGPTVLGERPCLYRVREALPCLRPWREA